MYETQMILTRGFQNVSENGQTTGFQMLVRITYYRGIFLDLIGNFEIAVDGEQFPRENVRFSVGGRTYTLDEAGKTENVHWDFGVPAILTVHKPGGLKPGIHDIRVTQQIRPSYIPGNGFVTTAHKKMTLVA
jgi:hypothetical protein